MISVDEKAINVEGSREVLFRELCLTSAYVLHQIAQDANVPYSVVRKDFVDMLYTSDVLNQVLETGE